MYMLCADERGGCGVTVFNFIANKVPTRVSFKVGRACLT